MKRKTARTPLLVALAGLAVGACASGTTAEVIPPEASQALAAARQALEARAGVPLDQIEVERVEQVDWADSCLELPEPDEACAQVITPGWLVLVQVAGEEIELHTDASGAQVRTESIDLDELAPGAAQEARRVLAGELDVQLEELLLLSSEQVDWTDTCLGLGGPAESCAQAVTPGWRLVFALEGDQYEIRTDELGTQVRIVP